MALGAASEAVVKYAESVLQRSPGWPAGGGIPWVTMETNSLNAESVLQRREDLPNSFRVLRPQMGHSQGSPISSVNPGLRCATPSAYVGKRPEWTTPSNTLKAFRSAAQGIPPMAGYPGLRCKRFHERCKRSAAARGAAELFQSSPTQMGSSQGSPISSVNPWAALRNAFGECWLASLNEARW